MQYISIFTCKNPESSYMHFLIVAKLQIMLHYLDNASLPWPIKFAPLTVRELFSNLSNIWQLEHKTEFFLTLPEHWCNLLCNILSIKLSNYGNDHDRYPLQIVNTMVLVSSNNIIVWYGKWVVIVLAKVYVLVTHTFEHSFQEISTLKNRHTFSYVVDMRHEHIILLNLFCILSIYIM